MIETYTDLNVGKYSAIFSYPRISLESIQTRSSSLQIIFLAIFGNLASVLSCVVLSFIFKRLVTLDVNSTVKINRYLHFPLLT